MAIGPPRRKRSLISLSAVIPGRREAAGPESRKTENPDALDSGLAPSARPGMTAEILRPI
jgi:hypothetical protein